MEIFLWDQWFLALLNNGENRGLGIEAFWFQPKQLFSDCSAIERHWPDCSMRKVDRSRLCRMVLNFAINGENMALGNAAVCFWLKQFLGSRSTIDRDWSRLIGKFKTCVPEGLGRGFFCRVNGFCHCGSMEKNRVLGLEAGCRWWKQLVGDCTSHWPH